MKSIKSIFHIFFLIFYITSCSSGISQTQTTDLATMNLKGAVKQVKQFTYTAVEKFGEIQKGDFQPKIFGPENQNMVLTFDKDGFTKEKRHYDKAGNYNGNTIVGYDEHKHRFTEISYNINKDIDVSVRGIYNKEKRELNSTIHYHSINDSATKIDFFDDFGRKIKTDWLGAKGKLTSRVIYKYDTRGNLIEETTYSSNGALSSKTRNTFDGKNYKVQSETEYNSELKTYYFKYDNFGNVIEEYGGRPGDRVVKTIYKYKYDKNNNWIERVSYLYGELPVDFTERHIEYY